MELVNGYGRLLILQKNSIADVWEGLKYAWGRLKFLDTLEICHTFNSWVKHLISSVDCDSKNISTYL